MNQYFQDAIQWAPQFGHGLLITIQVSISAMFLSMILGLLIAIGRITEGGGLVHLLRLVLRAYVEILRGMPLIVTLFLIYFGLPLVGIRISDPLIAGVLGLTLALGAYLSEVFRAAILAIDKGQMEAATAFGMSRYRAYRHVVLPQALVVAVPTLGGYFIGLLKDSSLLSFISVTELLSTANELVSITFRAFEIYLMVAAIYLVLSFIAAWLVALVEKRLRPLEIAYKGGRISTDLGAGPAVPTFTGDSLSRGDP
jgi:His/Glu/Gln/Arg/opine family amino acid ABC transporter permease subunit